MLKIIVWWIVESFPPSNVVDWGDLKIYEWYIPLGFYTWRHVLKEYLV